MIKKALMIISAIPLCMYLPYLFSAWSGSRLDKLDWIFYLLAMAAAVRAAWGEKIGKCDYCALLLLIPALLLSSVPSLHWINSLGIAASAGVIFAAVWLLGSWVLAYRLLPVFVILLLGTPSSSYQLSLLLMCPVYWAWIIKFLLAGGCLFWIWCNKQFALHLKRGTVFFSAAFMCSCFLLLHTRELYFEGKSFTPDYSARIGEFWGRTIQPDENTLRFFATGKVKQFRYTRNNTDISVLAVQCGKDVHEIHPASHCLRTGSWTVHAEKMLYLQDNFAVTEIDAEKGGNRILVWVWYSSEEFSTPSFLGFRRHFRHDGNYYTYQISIPVYDDVGSSRDELREFFQALKQEKQK